MFFDQLCKMINEGHDPGPGRVGVKNLKYKKLKYSPDL